MSGFSKPWSEPSPRACLLEKESESGGPAFGIILACALSLVFWIALALAIWWA
jgi:hypothetical protein